MKKKVEDLFPIDVEMFSPEEKVEWFATCKALESLLKKQMDTLRPFVLKEAQDRGNEWSHHGHSVSRTVRVGKAPDEAALLAYCHEKGIDPTLVFEQKTMWYLNPSKLDHLINIGKIPKGDIAHMYKDSEILEVTPSKEVKSLISGNINKLLSEGKDE